MSYVFRSAAVASFLVLASACSAPVDDAQTTSTALGEQTSLRFNADFTATVSAPLVTGNHLRIDYDVARSTSCRGDFNGAPAWSVTGFYRLAGGAVGSFEAGGFSPSHGTDLPIVNLDAAGDLEVWFQTTNRWGCVSYDSNYGKNFHFTVAPSPSAPGWIGNASFVTSRATCDGGPCASDFHPLGDGFTFDTWTRQRAAITSGYFEVWKAGTTDRDNPNLWRELDVELHWRVGSNGPFTTSYVSFDRRVGNNARYAFNLRDLDVLAGQNGGALTDASKCPTFPYSLSADAMYIDADVELYVTVNGVALRPNGGDVFHGKYENYRGLYAICLPQ